MPRVENQKVVHKGGAVVGASEAPVAELNPTGEEANRLKLSQVPNAVVSSSSKTKMQGLIWSGTEWVPASNGTNVGNGTLSDFENNPNVRNLEIDYIRPVEPATTIPGTRVQGRALFVKYFAPTTEDSQQANSTGVFLVDTGTPYSTTKPTVGNESDGVNQGNEARGYTGRVIGHIAKAQAQTGATSKAGGVIDFAYAYSAAAEATRSTDTASLIRQHAQYQCEDQTSGAAAGIIGAAWSIFVPRSIHSQEALTLGEYTGAEGDLAEAYASGVTTIKLETGQGAAGLRGSAFPGAGTVQIDVGALAEWIACTISGDTLTLATATKKAHAKYARVAVMGTNSGAAWTMSNGQMTTAAVINVSQVQVTSGIVLNAANGNGTISFIKQTTPPSAPSSTRVLQYVNSAGQLSWMASDGLEHHISATPLEEILLTGLGFKSWTFDWGLTSGATAPTAGTIYVRAIPLRAGQVIKNVDWLLGTAGAGTAPSHIYSGLCDSTGKMVAQSNDLAANAIWTTAAMAQAPLSGEYTVPADGMYYAVILQVGSWGTTQMTITKGVSGAVPGGIGVNAFGTAGTAQTGLPANGSSLTIAATNGINYWVGAS